MRKIISGRRVLIILGLIGLYILCRSLYFTDNLNFSTEQADFAKKSYELWQTKKIELIGPAISFRNNGRMIFQGSITYYFQWLFLIPGNFDPVISSYLFMIFCALMIIPLYFGVKNFSDDKKALLVCAVYSFLPLYIDYSRFFWNPNYQFVLTPLVIWIASIYTKNRKRVWLFFEGLLMGILLMFHYQYLIVIGIFFIFHLINKKMGISEFLMFITGITLGFFPMIFFELRHNFYNIRTLFMFLSDKSGVFGQGGGLDEKHYFLSISLCILALLTSIKKIKINWLVVGITCFVLFAICINKSLIKPSHGFGMATNWNYQDELYVNHLIRANNIEGYNVANLIYNTKASVQKYLLKIQSINIDEENYTSNKFLYVISDQVDPLLDPAYEVNGFKPATLKQKWMINSQYSLILYQRD